MHNLESVLENEMHKLLLDFEIQTDKLVSARRPALVMVPADHRIKLKESKQRDMYLDLARELKKLWNMKVTVIPIVIGVLGAVIKG